ncbi:hypothetical protein ACQEVB_25365 [Pseudonocardia sp. CA-107938]|uniref:hypothetical protein n=1 Tax=Pseudonocardia sp. CA-107938 TaxID=3240021 RepID=UPI003D8B93FF
MPPDPWLVGRRRAAPARSTRPGLDRPGPVRAARERAVPGPVAPAPADLGLADPAPADPAQVDPGLADPAPADPAQVDPDPAAPERVGLADRDRAHLVPAGRA